jgi:hypothetical protein
MRTNKTLYGLLAFGTLLFNIIGGIIVAIIFAANPYGFVRMGNRHDVPDLIWLLLTYFAVYLIVGIFSIVMYLIHSNRSPLVAEKNKVLWVVMIILGGSIARIAYFFMYILNEEDELQSLEAKRKLEAY